MDFESILRERGLKSTPQRNVILSQVYEAGHIDIEQLQKNLPVNIKIPVGTLYRAVTELGNAGILSSISVNGLKTHYEITKDSHAHFVCDECGGIVDMEYDASTLLKDNKCKNYRINSVQLIVHGVCEACRTK